MIVLKNTMFLIPRELINEGNYLYERINNKLIGKKIKNYKIVDEILISKKFKDMCIKWIINEKDTYIFKKCYSNLNISLEYLDECDIKDCLSLIEKLLNYTRSYLSTICSSIFSESE